MESVHSVSIKEMRGMFDERKQRDYYRV